MTAVNSFEKLMEPGYIGSLRIKNRIIKTAAGTGYDVRRDIRPIGRRRSTRRSQKAGSGLSLQRAAVWSGPGAPIPSSKDFVFMMTAVSPITAEW